MKRIFEILVFLLITSTAFSAEPLKELEPFPTLEQFQTGSPPRVHSLEQDFGT